MARQHFYSRVPARVSLYNKRDGFDTFAQSEGLSRETVLGELAKAYNEKLNIHDPIKLRRGQIPAVYSQMMLSNGDVVHTSIGYLPKDFTGERSAYIAHSLIIGDEEMEKVFSSDRTDVFNPSMMIQTTDSFNLTARSSAPNPKYPEVEYKTNPLADFRLSIGKYNPEMVKAFLFAILSSLCDGGRDVYFRLPTDDIYASGEALAIINWVMNILPYDMRRRLSFVSFVSDPASYDGFKLKCVSSSCEPIHPSKGIFFDFATSTVTGQDASLQANMSVAGFLYSLLANPAVKEEFHRFIDSICLKYGIFVSSVKSFSEIVFLFWQCSGFYLEQSVLPTDEALLRFLDIYGRYREGLTGEQRVRAYRPLARYSSAQIAIPERIFATLSNLYPAECVPARAVALDVMLSLIHVDIMRDGLFALISANYLGEIDRVRAVIVGNLCRVFYGGFLQHKILAFFDIHFRTEPVEMRDLILDKLILSIRTPEIQRETLAFFDKNFGLLNHDQKMKVAHTCLEMLPECDSLSSMLVGLINRRLATDPSVIPSFMAQELSSMLDAFLKAGDGRLLKIFMESIGFSEDVAVRHIMTERVGGEIFIDLLSKMPAHIRAEKLMRMRRTLPQLSDEEYSFLLGTFTEVDVAFAPSTLYDMLRADAACVAELSVELCALFRKSIIYPAVTACMFDVFKVRYGKDGIKTVMAYAKDKEEILSSPEYAVVDKYVRMVKFVNKGDVESAFAIVYNLPDSAVLRHDIADYTLMCSLDRAKQGETTVLTYELIINYLKLGNFRFDTLYSKYRKSFEELRASEENAVTARLDPSDRRGAADAAELLMEVVTGISDASDELCELVISRTSGLKKALEEFFGIFGIGAAIFLKKKLGDGYEGVSELIDELVSERNSAISSFDDAVNLILRRK